MLETIKIALRNLTRYKRRSILTGLIIALGVAAVIIFSGVSGTFKRVMIGQITDSMLGHLQVHRAGYVSSIESLPLDRNIQPKAYDKLVGLLESDAAIEAFSPRLKLAAMLSNYETTTNVRLNGVDPDKEMAVAPDLVKRVMDRPESGRLPARGEILIPDFLAKGMQVKVGDTVVLVAHNKDGSVNGLNLKVAGTVENVTGPGGRDGYIHIRDAAELLRLEQLEISEVALRLKDFDRLKEASAELSTTLREIKNQKGQPLFEVHAWDQLTPFSNIVGMIDLMAVFIQVILISVVLVSVLNIMIMSVYERVREIGTIAAIGVSPGRILFLFLTEGLALGVLGSLAGAVLGGGVIGIIGLTGVDVTFGRNQVFSLFPTVDPKQMLYSCLMVIVVSALAALQPAYKASRLEPVDALRHV
ncbi:MAG: FtsX-like permease family protein [Pseudomonadota bacterium]